MSCESLFVCPERFPLKKFKNGPKYPNMVFITCIQIYFESFVAVLGIIMFSIYHHDNYYLKFAALEHFPLYIWKLVNFT